jgi:hypothetical protein
MRSYEKANPEKPVLEQQASDKGINVVEISIKDAGANYKKEDGVLLPKSFFVIISGGEKTERLYFNIISNREKFRRIKIEFVADPNQLNPDGLLETAKHKQNHYQSSQEEEPDSIFIVSDVDHFMSELLRIKPECEKLNIPLIISNSCFEIWLYYAYYDNNQIKAFPVPADKLKISKKFRQWMPSNINPATAILNIEQNIENARACYEEDENGIPELFSTNMFRLAESLLPLIENELSAVIAENEQKKLRYRKRY